MNRAVSEAVQETDRIFSGFISGKLQGFMGMVIGVPLFSTIYYIVKRLAEYSLKRQGKPMDTSSYIQEENNEQGKPKEVRSSGRKKEMKNED